MNKKEIIKKIKESNKESEIIELTEKYSEGDDEIYITGNRRWGEIKGMEAEVIAFQIGKNYFSLNQIIRTYAMTPKDGIYRTKDVKTGFYAGNVETMGIEYGIESAFSIIFEEGKKVFEDKFDVNLAHKVFKMMCNYERFEHVVSKENTKRLYMNEIKNQRNN